MSAPQPNPLPDCYARDEIRRRLLQWFDRDRRVLPWRGTRDPYRILVSEVMLQQTQVATVVPYYERFLGRFPTLGSLASAPEEEVLRLWAGLGYYSRARNLQRAARALLADHGGFFPSHLEDAIKLPGVGRYTAGAVLSIALGVPAPVVDGNVSRVLSRVFELRADPKTGPGQRRLWDLAGCLIPEDRPGCFNQAIMELGATLCTPRSPRCGECPLEDVCRARQNGSQEQLPTRLRSPASVPVEMVACVATREGQVLLLKPERSRRWRGLWQLPYTEPSGGEGFPDACRRCLRESAGLRCARSKHLVTLRHGITRYRILLHAFLCECRGEIAPEPSLQAAWHPVAALGDLGLPAPHRRIAQVLSAEGLCEGATRDPGRPSRQLPLLHEG